MKLKLIAVFAVAVLLFACSKPLPEDKLDYAGEWESLEMSLLILANGRIEYERTHDKGKTSIDAPIKEYRGNHFVVGIGPLTTTFVVNDPPHQVGGKWQMVVDGVRLTRVDDWWLLGYLTRERELRVTELIKLYSANGTSDY